MGVTDWGTTTERSRLDQRPLAPGWGEAIDPSTGKVYYWHLESQATTWERPEPLARTWCLWEQYHTVDCGARLAVVMSDEQSRRFRRALMEGEEGLESISRPVTSIDVARAETH